MHDIVFKNHQLARIKTLDELTRKRNLFSDAEFKQFTTHPQEIASMLGNFKETPADVGAIISEHHERPDGTGFPRKLSAARISPLTCVFIVAHDIVDAYFEGKTDLKDFIASYPESYKVGNFKKILSGLPTALGQAL